MKVTYATVLALLVLPSSLALAKEESPTPREKLNLRATDPASESEPSVSVPSERHADKYPKPGTPVATPAATPAATVAKTPTRSTPAATPAKPATAAKSPIPAKSATPTKSATPRPSPAATPKNAEAAVKDLENRWLAAVQSHDAATVQALVSDNYIGVTATGRSVTKSELLADIKKDKNNYDAATNTHMVVRVHGDSAVIVGTSRQSGKDATGKQFTYNYRWTDTWARQEGQWLCVASQSIQVPK